MGWVRFTGIEPVDGPFASFDVGGQHFDLKMNSAGTVTKNDADWIPGVGKINNAWLHLAVALDTNGGSFIRVTKPDGTPSDLSIPGLTLDSTTDIGRIGGTGTTRVKVHSI